VAGEAPTTSAAARARAATSPREVLRDDETTSGAQGSWSASRANASASVLGS
jgi:hypothetical protein